MSFWHVLCLSGNDASESLRKDVQRFSVGYQTLKLYGPALVTGSCYPDFDWICTTVELWAWSSPRVGIVGMSDGLDEDEVFQCQATEHCPSSCGCKMHIDELWQERRGFCIKDANCSRLSSMVEVELASTIFCFRCCVSQVPCHPVKGRKRRGLRHVDVKNGWMDGRTDVSKN